MIRSVAFAVALMVWIGAHGCGIKTAPVAPRQLPPPGVLDLTAGVTNDTVVLTWSLPAAEADVSSKPSGFIVYRARIPVSDTACPTCPKMFERAADVPVRWRDTGVYSYTEELTAGFIYTFKVNSYSKNGLSGEDSNEVAVSH